MYILQWGVFMSKRFLSLAFTMVLIFVSICGRIGYVIFSDEYIVSDSYNSVVLDLETLSPTIYYRDFTKATNNKTSYALIIRPNGKCLYELKLLFDKNEQRYIEKELQKGYPVVKTVDAKPNTKYIQAVEINSSENQLEQLVSNKSNGIFKHVNSPIGYQKVKFAVDATGKLLNGDNGTLIKNNCYSQEGYRISIDKNIQGITINATKNMYSGCALVMNIEDCSILALVNKPYNNYNIKAFQKYSIGSAFKLVVAIAAIENGLNPTYCCKGTISIGNQIFSCQNKKVHGVETLKSALANSCNCYFVNLANTLGGERILDICNELNFDSSTELFDNWKIENALLPTYDELKFKGELSLFGFGQGKLLVTPLQMCSFLCTVGNGGTYGQPKLFLSNINNKNKRTSIIYPTPKRVLKQSTCNRLVDYMRYVVTNGTGATAEDKNKKSAGKTATAQTGQYFFGQEKLNTWFVGIYPYDNPKYAIVIMTENGTSGSKNCCPIFRTIVEQL